MALDTTVGMRKEIWNKTIKWPVYHESNSMKMTELAGQEELMAFGTLMTSDLKEEYEELEGRLADGTMDNPHFISDMSYKWK